MSKSRTAALVVASLIPSPALAADQFDLVCKAKRAEMHYRVDLARGEYCFGECRIIQKLAEVTSGTIFLRKHEAVTEDGPQTINRIDRATGEWYWYSFAPGPLAVPDLTRGVCEPAPFSGFPAAKF